MPWKSDRVEPEELPGSDLHLYGDPGCCAVGEGGRVGSQSMTWARSGRGLDGGQCGASQG